MIRSLLMCTPRQEAQWQFPECDLRFGVFIRLLMAMKENRPANIEGK